MSLFEKIEQKSRSNGFLFKSLLILFCETCELMAINYLTVRLSSFSRETFEELDKVATEIGNICRNLPFNSKINLRMMICKDLTPFSGFVASFSTFCSFTQDGRNYRILNIFLSQDTKSELNSFQQTRGSFSPCNKKSADICKRIILSMTPYPWVTPSVLKGRQNFIQIRPK